MDKGTQREMRLQELARSLIAGDLTEEERQEYDALQNEQSTELKGAMLNIVEKQVKPRLPKFLWRKS